MSFAQPEQCAAGGLLANGQQALKRGAWIEARHCFEKALAEGETPEALEGLGTAAWWLEDPATMFTTRERAYRLFRDRGDHQSAGRLATKLGFDYAVFRAELAISNGWLQRAHRLLDDLDPVPEQIWLTLGEAEIAYHTTGDMEQVRRLTVRAKELADRLGVLDLELMSLALEGLALVGMGEMSDGMRALDEATAAVVAGEMENFSAIATTMCLMVFACERVRDIDRASQWCERFMEFFSRHQMQAHLAFCRGHYASVLTARGRWREAEDQLEQALTGLQCRIAWTLSPFERLGELQRRQGRLSEAEESFERAYPYPPGILGKARMALDRGDHETALDLVESVLRHLSKRDRVERIAPLDVLVRIHCVRGEVEDAEQALQELEAITGIVRTDCLLALAGHARGLVAHAAGNAAEAKVHLEDALDLYERTQLPFDAALVRLDLARALHALGRRSPAMVQARWARNAFQSLGATAESARAQALAGELAGTATGLTILSPREMEVLKLLTQGLSNQQIADELFLSKHTVRRHVSSILTKLDVPTRTAAVAHALELKLT